MFNVDEESIAQYSNIELLQVSGYCKGNIDKPIFFSSACDTMTIEKQSEYDQFNGISGNVLKKAIESIMGKVYKDIEKPPPTNILLPVLNFVYRLLEIFWKQIKHTFNCYLSAQDRKVHCGLGFSSKQLDG